MTGTTDKSIGWVGSLHEAPLAGVLKKVAIEERSGDFQVIAGRTIKTVYFDRGFVVFAASNLKRDRLGESMIDLGRISRHEFAIASLLMKNSRRKFGQALVQAGLMSEEELGRQVALQVNRILLSLFKVGDGIYSFDERPSIIPVELMVSLSIYRILLDGIRFMTDERLIRSGLPSIKTRVRVAQRPPFTINVRKLKPVEQEVLRAAGQGVSIESRRPPRAHSSPRTASKGTRRNRFLLVIGDPTEVREDSSQEHAPRDPNGVRSLGAHSRQGVPQSRSAGITKGCPESLRG